MQQMGGGAPACGSPKKGCNTASRAPKGAGKETTVYSLLSQSATPGCQGSEPKATPQTCQDLGAESYPGLSRGRTLPQLPRAQVRPSPALLAAPRPATLSCPGSPRLWQARTLPAWQEPRLSTSKESPLKYHFAISNPPRRLDPCHGATNTSTPMHAQDAYPTRLERQVHSRGRRGFQGERLGGSTGVRAPVH